MTANEIATEYLQLLDKETSNSAPHFEDSEISITLSQAQEEYVKRMYNYRGNKYQSGFENTEKRRKDLNQLTKSAVIQYDSINNNYIISYQNGATEIIDDSNGFFSDPSIIKPNGSLWKLPKDFLWSINEEISYNTTNACFPVDRRVNVKPVSHDEYNKWIYNIYKKPYEKLVWRLDYSSEFDSNEYGNVLSDNTNSWYRVVFPQSVTNSRDYTLVINGAARTVTTDGTATTAELISLFEIVFSSYNIQYYIINNTIFIYSNAAITTTVVGTNDILIYNSYVPIISDNSRMQRFTGRDSQTHELITNGWSIARYYIRYIKKPRAIIVDFENPDNQVNCELNDITIREIIDIAVRKTLSSLQDPRIQTQLMEEQKSE